MADGRYCFIVEWYDPNAAFMRKYQLFFYPQDNSIEMFDLKNHRAFLKRTKAENVNCNDMYIGSTVNILSRQLHFIDYGDDYTRSKLGREIEKTLCLVKPDAIGKIGEIIEVLEKTGFQIRNMKMCQMSRKDAQSFSQEQKSEDFFNAAINVISSGPVVALELTGYDAVRKFQEMLGPEDPAEARSTKPTSLRARFGTDKARNACHGSASLDTAVQELNFFFPMVGPSHACTAKFSDCTCCIIKPHIIREGKLGAILNRILEAGFEISAMQIFHLEKANAEEFLEVYRGVVQEYPQMVNELTGGPCMVLEIHAQNAPQAFREMAGPSDPEIARHLRPRTLRAQFGHTKIQNAVHCTDLPEDGQLEVEYFFKILQQ